MEWKDKLLTGKTKDEYKRYLYEQQNGLCVLCERPLEQDILKNHLDHDHALEGVKQGKCRGLLCTFCNGVEGEVARSFSHSGLVPRGVDRRKWFANLLDYWDRDLSFNPLFPSYPNDKYKAFKRLTKTEMIGIMQSEGFEYNPDDTREAIAKAYKKQLVKRLKKG